MSDYVRLVRRFNTGLGYIGKEGSEPWKRKNQANNTRAFPRNPNTPRRPEFLDNFPITEFLDEMYIETLPIANRPGAHQPVDGIKDAVIAALGGCKLQ